MQTQTRFIVGGATSVAASVAVACAVALTNSAALADTAGAAIGAGAIVVPTRAEATPHPVASEVPTSPSTPVTVPAPEPREVAIAEDAGQAPTVPPAEPAGPAEPAADEAQLLAELKRSGSWDAVYAWARERGWNDARVREFVDRLPDGFAERFTGSRDKHSAEDGGRFRDERHWGDRGHHGDHRFGSKQDQSRYSPDRRD